jgi:hypothetical protein
VTGIGGALAVIGAFLTWAKVSVPGLSVSFSGTSDEVKDGWYTLIAGIVILLVGVLMFAQGAKRWHGAVALLGGAIILVFTIIDIVDADEGVGIGFGLWMTVVAGVLAVVGGVMAMMARPQTGMMAPPAA